MHIDGVRLCYLICFFSVDAGGEILNFGLQGGP